jgi:hypothetical protein
MFTEKSQVSIAQKVAGFKRKNTSMSDYCGNIKNVKDNFLPA